MEKVEHPGSPASNDTDGSGPLEPRAGVVGYWDRLVGPTATPAEQGLTIATASLWTVAVCGYAVDAELGWSALQFAVVAVITFDVAGGVTANATASGRRWWHRDGRTDVDHFTFVAAHVHPFVLAALFADVTWTAAAIVYTVLLLASTAILSVGPSLRRATALALFSGWVLFAAYQTILPVGLEWFGTLLALKLLVSHLVGGE
ncbi:hypothetical protein [Natronoglomus mannanivorans]|uniref:Uncharacterized protein n=1 Tax=Natronoglomus mannanivorans TaxID=2979990 RepID=A0AAP2YXF3_9EURY|nr:hypothetical protein [Halobacteria archaeon AArc-xg1-1]